MKKLFFVVLSVFISFTVFGQAGTQHFGLSAGAMFPMNDLSDSNLADSSSGASSAGYHLMVSYSYQFNDYFGLGVDVEFNSAKYSMSKIASYYESLNDNTKREIESTEGWSIGGIFLRYYLNIPLTGRISWQTAPLLGAIGTYSPEYQIKATPLPSGQTKLYYRQRSKAFSFAYGFETRLCFHSQGHGLFFEGRLIDSKAKFNEVTGTGYDDKAYSFPVKMNVMFITASLGYSFAF